MSGCYLILLRGHLTFFINAKKKSNKKKFRIRLIFSTADLQSAEDFDPADEEGSASAESGEPNYPLRCSLTITKVRTYTHLLSFQPSLICRFD